MVPFIYIDQTNLLQNQVYLLYKIKLFHQDYFKDAKLWN